MTECTLEPASLVVISLAPEASVEWIRSNCATQAAARIIPGKYLAFLADRPGRFGIGLYLHPVLRNENIVSSRKNLVILGGEGTDGRSLQPSTPLPWPVPCAIDAAVYEMFGLRHLECHPSSSQPVHFDNALWDSHFRSILKEVRCQAVEEMQGEMDKYHIPLKDRHQWSTSVSPSEPSTIRPPGYPWLPLIQVDVSPYIDTLTDIPDHRELDKELREIHRIRRLFSRPAYERSLAWIDVQFQEMFDVHTIPDIPDTPIDDASFYLDSLFDLKRPKGSNSSDVPSSRSSNDSLTMGNDDRGIKTVKIVTDDLPAVIRENIKVVCIDVFRTLIDQEAGIYNALRPMLHRAGSDIQSTKVLGIFADIEADLQTCDEPMSYPELLRRAFSVLTHQLGIVNTAEEEQGFINSVTAWEAFPDSVQTIRRLGAYIPLIALANVDATMYDSVRSKIDMDNIFSGAITITSQFRPIPCSFQALISHCKEKFNARPEEILVVGSSVFHDLAPAWEMGIPVTWISRNSAVVGSRRVEYCYTKRPSAIFSNLSDFAQWFINRPSLRAGQPNPSDSRPLFSITNAYTPADDSQLSTDLRHKSNGV